MKTKKYYYSILTDEVSTEKTSSMRKYPKSYRVVQFRKPRRANLKLRKGYADEYMHEVCYQQIKAALDKDRDVYSIFLGTDKYGDDYFNTICISNEKNRDFCKGDKFLGDSIPVPHLSRDIEAFSKFNELAKDRGALTINASSYVDDRFYGACNVAIKPSAIDMSDVSYSNSCITVNIYMGNRRFQINYIYDEFYKSIVYDEFYKNIVSDKETMEKFKFDIGAIAKLIKLDISYAQKEADENRKHYNASLKRLKKLQGYYESLAPEEMLIAEVSD